MLVRTEVEDDGEKEEGDHGVTVGNSAQKMTNAATITTMATATYARLLVIVPS
tara:strand:+ start:533 stop:691 length:159 start_codon:yes stop_codon:yes gene_type:complete